MNDTAFNGIVIVLTVQVAVLVALKLAGVIAWSWWWVLSPWWASVGLAAVVFVLPIMAALFDALLERRPFE